MAHFAGHDQPPGQFTGQFAPEFQGDALLRNIQIGQEPRRQQQELRLGQLSRTRQLSPSQEAFLISRGQEAQSEALVNARLRADAIRAQEEQRERLIAEGRQFDVGEEQRIFRRNQAIREQEQRQGLLGSIFGNIAGLGGRLLGGAFGGPIGAAAVGGLTDQFTGGNQNIGGIPPTDDPLAFGFR